MRREKKTTESSWERGDKVLGGQGTVPRKKNLPKELLPNAAGTTPEATKKNEK